MGVSVFFVISGYLISGIILKRLTVGSFSFLDFYARRSRRIVPALALVLLAVWVVGRFLLWSDEFTSLGQHVFNSALFTENIRLSKEISYFDRFVEYKPLLHFWSLGIEEQFYLFWPILLVLTFRYRKSWGLFALFGLGVASLGYKLYDSDPAKVEMFYLLPARFWELMLGGALAYREFVQRQALKGSGPVYAGLSVIAFVGLFAFSFFYDPKVITQNWYLSLATLVPTLCTVVLIGLGPKAWVNKHVLALPVFTGIGKISYPLYLWHWPALSFLRIYYYHAGETQPSALLVSIAVACSFLLAFLTYRFIELPAQRKLFFKFPERKKAIAYVSAGLGALVVLGALGMATHKGVLLTAEQKRQETLSAAYSKFKKNPKLVFDHWRDDCNFYTTKPIASSCVTPKTAKKIFLWGDSHAQHLYYGLSKSLPKDVSILQVASSLCRVSVLEDKQEYCNTANKFALDHIRTLKPDLVILAQDRDHETTPWLDVVKRIRSYGVKNIIVLGPVPHWHPSLYQIVARYYLDGVPSEMSHGVSEEFFETEKKMKNLFKGNTQATYFSFLDQLCKPAKEPGRHSCTTMVGSDVMTDLLSVDDSHLTLNASVFVAKKMLNPMIAQLLLLK